MLSDKGHSPSFQSDDNLLLSGSVQAPDLYTLARHLLALPPTAPVADKEPYPLPGPTGLTLWLKNSMELRLSLPAQSDDVTIVQYAHADTPWLEGCLTGPQALEHAQLLAQTLRNAGLQFEIGCTWDTGDLVLTP